LPNGAGFHHRFAQWGWIARGFWPNGDGFHNGFAELGWITEWFYPVGLDVTLLGIDKMVSQWGWNPASF